MIERRRCSRVVGQKSVNAALGIANISLAEIVPGSVKDLNVAGMADAAVVSYSIGSSVRSTRPGTLPECQGTQREHNQDYKKLILSQEKIPARSHQKRP